MDNKQETKQRLRQQSPIKVDKSDAARLQIETAIELWFTDGDPVSIHTLAAAAHQILNDLGNKEGTIFLNQRTLPQYGVKDGGKSFKDNQNFFKHADKDPNHVRTFHPGLNELLLFDCVHSYSVLARTLAPNMCAFWFWFRTFNSDIFLPSAIEGFPIDLLQSLGRREYFFAFLEIFCEQRTRLVQQLLPFGDSGVLSPSTGGGRARCTTH